MGGLVCIDTHVLIWGIKEEATLGQEPMIERTKRFIVWLNEAKKDVLIPTLVLSEALINLPKNLHQSFIDSLAQSMIIAPFDFQAASIYSDLYKEKKGDGAIENLKNNGLSREVIKADGMIVAIALANKAECIYSNDKNGIKQFSDGHIPVFEIPDVPLQGGLF